MHSLLEDYLSEVAAYLTPLPVKRRNEELREMRAHLENAVIVNQELGQTEEDAVQNALVQFGLPEALGENVVWAWRREKKLSLQSCLKAAACTVAMTILLGHLMPLLHFYSSPVVTPLHSSLLLWGEGVLWLMPMFVLVGGVSGFLSPKRSVEGVALGMDAFLFYFLVTGSVVAVKGAGTPDNFDTLLIGFSHTVVLAIISAASAWIGSRWRTRGMKRSRV